MRFVKCSLFRASGENICGRGLLTTSQIVRTEVSACISTRVLRRIKEVLRMRLTRIVGKDCRNCLKISVVVYHARGNKCTVRPYIRVGLHVGVKIMTHLVCSGCIYSNIRKQCIVRCCTGPNRT